ncbi:MAG: type II secretion system protein GspC [Gammaproteobacteria bacterium]|nr:type II secretion system protein GspC [Gammaproteobacteria bacterium]
MMMKPALDWKKAWDMFFLDTVQRRIIILVQVALVLLLAATLAGLTWRLIPAPAPNLAPPPEAFGGAAARRNDAGPGIMWDLAKWHLFGEKPVASEIPSVESLPETQLNLTLSGVVASGSMTGGGAIIAAPGGVEAFYPVNSQLPGGAVLKEVHPDRVVLERNGRLETLRLPKEGLGNVSGEQPEASGGQATQSRAANRGGAGPAAVPANLREFRDMVLSDPQSAGSLVQINPKSADGRFVGYELQPGQDAALFARAGLSPGDIVTSVNGVKLDSPAKALSLLRGLTSAEEVRLEIERGGVPQSLIMNINQ